MLMTKKVNSSAIYNNFVNWASSYAESANTLAANKLPAGTTAANSPRIRMTLPSAAASGQGYGSSWGAVWGFYAGSIIGALAHAFPSADVFNESLRNTRIVVFTNWLAGTGSVTWTAKSRNGYTTAAISGTLGEYAMPEFIYYDYSLNNIMTVNPYGTTTPSPFVLPS